jgi:hypothetical protein
MQAQEESEDEMSSPYPASGAQTCEMCFYPTPAALLVTCEYCDMALCAECLEDHETTCRAEAGADNGGERRGE